MKIQFFLKNELVEKIMRLYGFPDLPGSSRPLPGEHKGLVFSVDFFQNATFNYEASGHVVAVDKPGGLIEIPDTAEDLCPHPPPCIISKDKNGEAKLVYDPSNPALPDCYR